MQCDVHARDCMLRICRTYAPAICTIYAQTHTDTHTSCILVASTHEQAMSLLYTRASCAFARACLSRLLSTDLTQNPISMRVLCPCFDECCLLKNDFSLIL